LQRSATAQRQRRCTYSHCSGCSHTEPSTTVVIVCIVPATSIWPLAPRAGAWARPRTCCPAGGSRSDRITMICCEMSQLTQSGHTELHCTCLLMTQSGHCWWSHRPTKKLFSVIWTTGPRRFRCGPGN